MLTANLVLDNQVGSDVTFNLRQYLVAGLGGAVRYNVAAPDQILRIAHQETGKGVSLVERHLTSITIPTLGPDGVTYYPVVTNYTIAVPGIVSVTDAFTASKNALAHLISLYCGAFSTTTGLGANVTNLSAFLNGES